MEVRGTLRAGFEMDFTSPLEMSRRCLQISELELRGEEWTRNTNEGNIRFWQYGNCRSESGHLGENTE